jgi:tetratricopeptide (TPR) repeat protein
MQAVPGMHDYSTTAYAGHRLQVLGDTRAMAQALATNPDLYGTGQERFYFDLPYVQRDFPRALQAIDAYPDDPLQRQFYLLLKSQLRAIVADAQGDTAAADRHAREALAALDAILARTPDDGRALLSRARMLAILGRDDEARDAAGRALVLPTEANDALMVANFSVDRLRVLALVADSDELAREMDDYLQMPAKYWHYDGLLLDPVFDRHRAHPAFVTLAKRYSRVGSTKEGAP